MEDYAGSGAYGAGGATGQCNPVAFIKKPDVILRIIGWVLLDFIGIYSIILK